MTRSVNTGTSNSYTYASLLLDSQAFTLYVQLFQPVKVTVLRLGYRKSTVNRSMECARTGVPAVSFSPLKRSAGLALHQTDIDFVR